jgi:hypothetical protein
LSVFTNFTMKRKDWIARKNIFNPHILYFYKNGCILTWVGIFFWMSRPSAWGHEAWIQCLFNEKPWEMYSIKLTKIRHLFGSLFDPFISITPSKPLMSSRSWLTLHNCEIWYLSAVNYDPATTYVISIMVNIYPRFGVWVYSSLLSPFIWWGSLFTLLAEVTIYPAKCIALFWLLFTL